MSDQLYLLVGGSHDGERESGQWLTIEVFKKAKLNQNWAIGVNDPLPEIEYELYTRRHFAGGPFSGVVLYALEDMDDDDVMQELVEKYPGKR